MAILGHSVSPDQPRSDLSIILADHIESLVNPTPTSTSTIPSSGTEMPPWLGVLLQRQDKADNLAQEQQRLLTEHSRLQTIMMEKLTSLSASKPTSSPPPACTVVPPTLPPRVAPALPVAPAAQNVADELQKVIQPYQEFLMEQVKSGGSVFRWATAHLFQTHREGSAHDLLRSGVRALSIIEALMGTQPHTFQLASSKFLMEATHTEADSTEGSDHPGGLSSSPMATRPTRLTPMCQRALRCPCRHPNVSDTSSWPLRSITYRQLTGRGANPEQGRTLRHAHPHHASDLGNHHAA